MPVPENSSIAAGAELRQTESTRREHVPVRIFDEPADMSTEVAKRVANLIIEKREAGQQVVLGLPTGSTPIGVYKHLIRMHDDEGLDFSHVVTFNLDEYYPMKPDSLQSYHRFMHENFFDHVNIPDDQIHIPRGDISREEVDSYCLYYERAIEQAGGIDLMLLGIGRSGHIGFNEPGSSIDTRTRAIVLDEITRKDAASDFFGDENVPREALTMGVGTILDAREIILLATGEHKAPIVRRAVEEEPSREVTASFLQRHRHATIYADEAAAGDLTRVKAPWLVTSVEWTEDLAVRAVIWLSERVGKSIMRLETADFHRHSLHSLVYHTGNTDDLCRTVFEALRRKVRYQEDLMTQSKVIVFSPHPDDDVISMGGMLDKLVANDNDVLVSYMTNGSVAVFDADVRRYIRFMEMAEGVFELPKELRGSFESDLARLREEMESKPAGAVDSETVQRIKSFIRYAEAIAAIEVMGLGQNNARFLDLPFYKTGRVRKDPIGEQDIEIVDKLLQRVEPDHIFVAGDLSDPHGTHRMCYSAIQQALGRYNARSESDSRPTVWLYRGAWQEWEIHRADIFIPLSKGALDRKIEAIFKHESQKDRAMYPGAYDSREFWERARDRNRETADRLNALGLPEFYAVEAFVRSDTL